MTKQDLFDWIICHNCTVIQLPEHKAKVIMFENPKNSNQAYIDLPIDTSGVRDYSVYRVCSRLSIPAPNLVDYMKPIHDNIENNN